MKYHISPNIPIYRVTRIEDKWADVLKGIGSFFGSEGRYHVASQETVYAADDPLVALTEFAWHQGRKYCKDLAKSVPLNYPLVATAKLWNFQFSSPLSLIDLTDPSSALTFAYTPQAISNPLPDQYHECQRIATLVRNHIATKTVP